MDRVPATREVLGKSASAYEHLKHSAINGLLRPNRRLAPSDLADYFGVSVTPVRDALVRLAAEGFVAWEMSHGYFSKPFTLEEQRDLHQMQILLLGTSMQLAQERAPPYAFLQELAALTYGGDDGPGFFADKVEELHQAYARACGNQVLANWSRLMSERTHMVRLLALRRASACDHMGPLLQQFGRAMLDGDVDQGLQIMQAVSNNHQQRLPALVQEANVQAMASRFP